MRKLAKKDPTWRSKIKKDPGIPNLFPYKEKLLHEVEEKKRLKQEAEERAREEARNRRKAEKAAAKSEGQEDGDLMMEDVEQASVDSSDVMTDDGADEKNPMAALLESAQARAAEWEDNDDEDEDDFDDDEDDEDGMDEDRPALGINPEDIPTLASQIKSKEGSRRAFDKVFKQVVEAADVVLYVLDARDPEGTRSREVEREIMAAEGGSKRLILILNKIDLVPPQVLKGWLVHLRRYFPTLPLRASNPAPNAHTFDHKHLTVKGTAETLLKALKSYANGQGQVKRSISVGVIGYPNVGKSSVINALMARLNRGQSHACPTGAEAGVTTSLREVKLDSKVKLIDSPGIVFPSEASNNEKKKKKKSAAQRAEDQARLVLLSAVPPKHIDDPIPAVSLLLRRLSSSETLLQKMLDVYGIPPLFPHGGSDRTTDFLIQVARKRGRLGKGGVPNLPAAAMTVITDWRDGRIQGWVEPPTLPVAAPGAAAGGEVPAGADTKEIVSEWAKEFKIEGLWGDGQQDDDAMVE